MRARSRGVDARAFAWNPVSEERHELAHRVGRALGMDLAGGPHPAHDTQIAGLGDHGLGSDAAAGGRPQRPVASRW